MIVFDLRCPNAHVFEAWFGSTEDFTSQRERGLVQCPLCGDSDVEKAVMAPNVAPKGNSRPDRAPAPPASLPAAAMPPQQMKEVFAAIARLQAKVMAECDYVGDRFAEEARAIHHGESEERGIYGEATRAEAEALAEEGIDIAALPFPIGPGGDA